MKTPAGRRGFTLIEVLLIMTMASILAAISVPRFFQAQKRARHSEAVFELKRLHVGMSTQRHKPVSIHVPGFNPQRGNRYSYHVAEPCLMIEDRSTRRASSHPNDDCIGVDTFANPTLPSVFMPALLPGASWDMDALMNGMDVMPGFYGSETSWDYLAYAAGDLDGDPNDTADTWGVASADGQLFPICSAQPEVADVPAGEPFLVNDDGHCF
jgi:prepilin-type N-terminal cleavage/methylation domain-containing protein